MAKCKRCVAGIEHEFQHGTRNGYGYHSCRCDACRSVAVAHSSRRCQRCRAGDDCATLRHGTALGYTYHLCRCAECRGAESERLNILDPDHSRRREYSRKWRESNPGAKCLKCAMGDACQFRHGTASAYTYHGCRCRSCRDYTADRAQKLRTQNPEKARATSRRHYARNRESILDRAKTSKRRYYQNNTEYVRKRAEAYASKCREMYGSGPRHRTKWSDSDDLIAKRNDITTAEIAVILGRSIRAVETRRSRMRSRRAPKG